MAFIPSNLRISVWLVLLSLSLSACSPAESTAPQSHSQPSAIDIGFAQHMSQHHDQAVLLVSLFLQNHQTALRPFARGMHDAQLLELGQMRGWLSLWGQALVPKTRAMDWMLVGRQAPDKKLQAYLLACQDSPGGMPGLATAEQLNALMQAKGAQRDALFLRLMQGHHEGGLPMLEFAAREAKLVPVRQLAQRMLQEQTREAAKISAALVSG